jgi:hypothetical protein
MKCDNVQRRLAAYAENGLRVADELAIDIHLIQCDACRNELEALKHWERECSVTFGGDSPDTDWLALAEGLDTVEIHAGRAALVRFASVWNRFFRGAAALGIAGLLLFGVNMVFNEWRLDRDHEAQAAPKSVAEHMYWGLQYDKQRTNLKWIDTFDALPK